MAKLEFTLLTADPNRLNVVTTRFGTNAANKFTDIDRAKFVKRGTDGGNHVLAADGDEIQGWVDSISPGTQDGFSWGGAARPGTGQRCEVQVSGAALAIGDRVVVAAPVAVGTALGGKPKVKAGTPATYKWEVINLMGGAGAVGTTVLIERVA